MTTYIFGAVNNTAFFDSLCSSLCKYSIKSHFTLISMWQNLAIDLMI